MVMTTLPVYGQLPKTATAVAVAAVGNLAADAPTGTVKLFQAGPNGAQLTRLTATTRTTTTANCLMAFLAETALNPTNNGVNPGTIQRMFDSTLMPTTAVSATAAIPPVAFNNYSDSRVMRLAPFDSVYVATGGAGNVVFKAEYVDY